MPKADMGTDGIFLDAGIQTPAVLVSIDALKSSQRMFTTDITVQTTSGLLLGFVRIYENPYGKSRGHLVNVGGTFSHDNTVGESWSHSLNVNIRPSADYSSISYVDEFGFPLVMSRESTDGGVDTYTKDGMTIERNQTTGTFKLTKPDGLIYNFSADANGVARLENIQDVSGNQMTLTYDDPTPGVGKLTRVDAPSGDDRYLELQHTASGLISQVALKNTTSTLKYVDYTYDTNNRLISTVEDGEAVSVDYAYTSVDLGTETGLYISSLTDKASVSYLFDVQYTDTEATLTTTTLPDGLQTTFNRDPSTLIMTVDNLELGSSIQKTQFVATDGGERLQNRRFYTDATNYEEWDYEYYLGEYLIDVVSPISSSSYVQYTYTAEGQVASIRKGELAEDPLFTWTYPAGETIPTSMTAPTGEVTQYAYDANDRLLQTIAPQHDGTTGVQYAYTSIGDIATITDPLGKVTTYAYDAFGNPTSITDPLSNVTTFEYDGFGRRTKVTDPNTNSTTYTYSGTGCSTCGSSGNLVMIVDADNNVTEFQYDANSNRVKTIDPMGIETDFEYDDQNRPTKTIFPSGSTNETITTYDVLGQVASVQDPNGNLMSFTYNHVGRQTGQTDPMGSTTNTYDGFGNLTSFTDENSQTWSYDHDAYNQFAKVTDPVGNVAMQFYDASGRVTSVAAGVLGDFDPTEYFYDTTTGLLDETRYTSGTDIKSAFYEYDGTGQLMRMRDWIDGVNGVQYTFDDAGRTTSVTDYDGSVLSFTYDLAGNVLSTNDYHGNVTNYVYTVTNLVDTLTAPGDKVWIFLYDGNGLRTQSIHPNGLRTDYTYDGQNRLSRVEYGDEIVVSESVAFLYDNLDNTLRKTHEDGSYWEYSVDNRYRLTSSIRRDSGGVVQYSESYTYDSTNNIIDRTVTEAGSAPVTVLSTYNGAGKLTTEVLSGESTSFIYDDWGRNISKSNSSYTATFSYHYNSDMVNITSSFPGEENITILFGGNGRMRERVASVEGYTWFNWDNSGNIVSEEAVGTAQGNGPLVNTYTEDLAEVEGSNPATGDYRFFFSDTIGSRTIYDDSGIPTAGYEIDAFGDVYEQFGATPINLSKIAAISASMGGGSCGPGDGKLQRLIPERCLKLPYFTPACSDHDKCYGCEAKGGDPCIGRIRCDKLFKADMKAICKSAEGLGRFKRMRCRSCARMYWLGVRFLGSFSYKSCKKKCKKKKKCGK